MHRWFLLDREVRILRDRSVISRRTVFLRPDLRVRPTHSIIITTPTPFQAQLMSDNIPFTRLERDRTERSSKEAIDDVTQWSRDDTFVLAHLAPSAPFTPKHQPTRPSRSSTANGLHTRPERPIRFTAAERGLSNRERGTQRTGYIRKREPDRREPNQAQRSW